MVYKETINNKAIIFIETKKSLTKQQRCALEEDMTEKLGNVTIFVYSETEINNITIVEKE